MSQIIGARALADRPGGKRVRHKHTREVHDTNSYRRNGRLRHLEWCRSVAEGYRNRRRRRWWSDMRLKLRQIPKEPNVGPQPVIASMEKSTQTVKIRPKSRWSRIIEFIPEKERDPQITHAGLLPMSGMNRLLFDVAMLDVLGVSITGHFGAMSHGRLKSGWAGPRAEALALEQHPQLADPWLSIVTKLDPPSTSIDPRTVRWLTGWRDDTRQCVLAKRCCSKCGGIVCSVTTEEQGPTWITPAPVPVNLGTEASPSWRHHQPASYLRPMRRRLVPVVPSSWKPCLAHPGYPSNRKKCVRQVSRYADEQMRVPCGDFVGPVD